MKITVLIALSTLLLFTVGCVTTEHIAEKTYPDTSDFQYYTISQLIKNNISGNYNTEGYVSKTYICPPCGENAICKPCMGENIVISEKKKTLTTYTLSDSDVILFTTNKNPEQFQIGKKYRFSINITDKKTTGQSINDIEVIGYS